MLELIAVRKQVVYAPSLEQVLEQIVRKQIVFVQYPD